MGSFTAAEAQTPRRPAANSASVKLLSGRCTNIPDRFFEDELSLIGRK